MAVQAVYSQLVSADQPDKPLSFAIAPTAGSALSRTYILATCCLRTFASKRRCDMLEGQTYAFKRCAIYTRKSTNHLLASDTNSLETQREICGAYIKSQRYRGWIELPKRYDDANQSGSGLERPALIELMKDIEAGKVDAVVVYKIDRLTRSLADFVRLVEIFDHHGISLNSISQAFDTSDSMGRMILNILLTFSQFERELIAERVAASLFIFLAC
jgi:hypothetical protein